jgi:hypothetical protein
LNIGLFQRIGKPETRLERLERTFASMKEEARRTWWNSIRIRNEAEETGKQKTKAELHDGLLITLNITNLQSFSILLRLIAINHWQSPLSFSIAEIFIHHSPVINLFANRPK